MQPIYIPPVASPVNSKKLKRQNKIRRELQKVKYTIDAGELPLASPPPIAFTPPKPVLPPLSDMYASPQPLLKPITEIEMKEFNALSSTNHFPQRDSFSTFDEQSFTNFDEQPNYANVPVIPQISTLSLEQVVPLPGNYPNPGLEYASVEVVRTLPGLVPPIPPPKPKNSKSPKIEGQDE